MAVKSNAEHIVDLPLVPVGRRPEVGDALCRRVPPRELDLEPNAAGRLIGEEMVDQGIVRGCFSFTASGFVHGRKVIKTQELGRSLGLEKTQHLLYPGLTHVEGRHIRGLGRLPDRIPKSFLQGFSKGPVPLRELNSIWRRGPHEIGPAFPEMGRRHGRPPDRGPIVARPPGVPRFGDPILENRPLSPLGASGHVENRPHRSLRHDLSPGAI